MNNADNPETQELDIADEAASPDSEPRSAVPRRELWDKLRWRAHWYFPNLIPHLHRSDRDYERKHDQEENEGTRVPTELELRTLMVWGVELYGPSEIDGLYTGLRKLGWGSAALREERDSLLKWVQRQRSDGSGGWFNVGHVVSQTKRGQYFMVHNYAPLPSEVDSLLVRVFQVTPSLTAVLVGFQLNESTAKRYEAELNRDRATTRRRMHRPRSISTLMPEHLKGRAVEAARADLRSVAGRWFDQHLPGYFCSLANPATFPTMELLMIQDGPILQEPEGTPRGRFFSWRRLLANVRQDDVWSCKRDAGLQLAMDQLTDDRKGLHIMAALDAAKFPEDELKYCGGRTPGGYLHVCNELLDGLLIHASTLEYLREQLRELSAARESLKSVRADRRNLMRSLDKIRSFFDRTFGTPVIARELTRHSMNVAWYQHDCPAFTAPGWMDGDEPRELAGEIRHNVHFLASRLTEEEIAMRSHFDQLSTILSVRESLRVQRRMEYLTIGALAIAAISLLIAMSNVDPWLNRLIELLNA